MIHDWPETLPRPERASWQSQPMEARRKTQPDAGPPRYRRRFTSVPRLVSLSLILGRQQRAEFDLFWQATAEGADLFRMPDPTTDGWALLDEEGRPLLVTEGVPLLLSGRWLCAWGDGTPVETLQGGEFRKAFSVVVMP